MKYNVTAYYWSEEEQDNIVVGHHDLDREQMEEVQDKYDDDHRHEWNVKIEKVVTCDCGVNLVLCNFTNTCPCGADYNLSGERLAPRSQWGEETGEHWTDCY